MPIYPLDKFKITASVLALSTAFSIYTPAFAVEEIAVEEITISASRIKRDGFEAPTPVSVISEDTFENTGTTNIADVINQIPAFSAMKSPAITGLNSTENGINALDLRGLGANRTLVLVNGRRHVTSGASGTVDTNVIPSIALERVEVVTGGASAAWGSDAVAGVVNMIYNKNLDGLKFESQYGISDKGDMDNYRLAAAYGGKSQNDRGHFLIAGEYNKSEGIGSPRSRDWGRKQYQILGNQFLPDAKLYFGHPDGAILSGFGQPPELADLVFGPGGAVSNREIGTRFPGPIWMVGGDGPDFAAEGTLVVPLERKNIMGSYEYKLTDDINVFFEGSMAKSRSVSPVVQGASFLFGYGAGFPIKSGNPFIPASVQATMDANDISEFGLVRTTEDMGVITADSSHVTYRVATGFNGTIDDNWSWEVYYQRGENTFVNIKRNNLLKEKFIDAIDVISDPDTGAPVCRIGGSCEPLNLFGSGSPSQAAIDYVTGNGISRTNTTQDVFSGSLSGDVFEGWAGPVSVSVGAEARRESLRLIVDKYSEESAYVVGNTQPLSGAVNVKEAFGEFVVPLLDANSGLGESMELNGAVRLTDYSKSGTVTTWKAGLTYRPEEQFLMRGAISRDIRAPNISELFTTSTLLFANVFNPLTGETELVQQINRGNPDLNPERAITKTLGMVYSPTWLDNLQLSVDWYDIKVSGAIAGVPLQEIVDNCIIEGNQTFCDALTIGGGNRIERISNSEFNIASLHSSGLDFEANYETEVGNSATLGFHVFGSYIIDKKNSPNGKVTTNRAGEVRIDNQGMPKFKLNGSVSYADGPWGVYSQVRFIGKAKYDVTYDSTQLADEFNNISPEVYVDLSARYGFKALGDMEVYGGINNVFDNDPPVVPYNFVANLQSNGGIYDLVGRFFYVGLRGKF